MIRQSKDKGGMTDPISLTIPNPLASRIRELHAISKVGDKIGDVTSIQRWCIEIIETFFVEKRKGVTR